MTTTISGLPLLEEVFQSVLISNDLKPLDDYLSAIEKQSNPQKLLEDFSVNLLFLLEDSYNAHGALNEYFLEKFIGLKDRHPEVFPSIINNFKRWVQEFFPSEGKFQILMDISIKLAQSIDDVTLLKAIHKQFLVEWDYNSKFISHYRIFLEKTITAAQAGYPQALEAIAKEVSDLEPEEVHIIFKENVLLTLSEQAWIAAEAGYSCLLEALTAQFPTGLKLIIPFKDNDEQKQKTFAKALNIIIEIARGEYPQYLPHIIECYPSALRLAVSLPETEIEMPTFRKLMNAAMQGPEELFQTVRKDLTDHLLELCQSQQFSELTLKKRRTIRVLLESTFTKDKQRQSEILETLTQVFPKLALSLDASTYRLFLDTAGQAANKGEPELLQTIIRTIPQMLLTAATNTDSTILREILTYEVPYKDTAERIQACTRVLPRILENAVRSKDENTSNSDSFCEQVLCFALPIEVWRDCLVENDHLHNMIEFSALTYQHRVYTNLVTETVNAAQKYPELAAQIPANTLLPAVHKIIDQQGLKYLPFGCYEDLLTAARKHSVLKAEVASDAGLPSFLKAAACKGSAGMCEGTLKYAEQELDWMAALKRTGALQKALELTGNGEVKDLLTEFLQKHPELVIPTDAVAQSVQRSAPAVSAPPAPAAGNPEP